MRSATRVLYVVSVTRLTETRLQINRIHQPQRFFIRQKGLLHLVHYVGECDFFFRVGKCVAAACAGMSKGSSRGTENPSRCFSWIFHKASRKRCRYLENPVYAI